MVAAQTNPTTKTIDLQSSRALDCVCLFSADIGGGVGPYLASFLRGTRHWDSAAIGVELSALGFASMLSGIPAGVIIDRIKRKRLLVAIAATCIGLSVLSLTLFSNFYSVFAAQITTGLATSFLGLGIISLALGLVGRQRFAARMGRNEAFTHFGNVLSAIAMGALGSFISHNWVFYVVAILASATVVSLYFIKEGDAYIDTASNVDIKASAKDASKSDTLSDESSKASFIDVLKDANLIAFALSAFLFNLANGAMLPLAAQFLSDGAPNVAPAYTAACIVTAQAMMIPTALLTGKFAQQWGRKPVFMIALFILLIRGVLFSLLVNGVMGGGAGHVIAVQLLDGISAGIFGVLASVVIADLAGHTKHYNLARASVGTVQAIGGSMSFLLAGSIVKASGYGAGFATLAIIALAAILFFYSAVPETKPNFCYIDP
jgi:MFS family permease